MNINKEKNIQNQSEAFTKLAKLVNLIFYHYLKIAGVNHTNLLNTEFVNNELQERHFSKKIEEFLSINKLNKEFLKSLKINDTESFKFLNLYSKAIVYYLNSFLEFHSFIKIEKNSEHFQVFQNLAYIFANNKQFLNFLQKNSKFKRENNLQTTKKKENRQTITLEEFQIILSLVKGKDKVKQRRILALVLLYLTGLRVSMLLGLKIKHVEDLLEKGATTLENFNIILSTQGQELLKNYKESFLKLCEGKNYEMLLFTPITDNTKPLPRETLDRELNHILLKASQQLNKHIRTHSLRVTVIKQLLKTAPIEKVKQVIGHKSIASTHEYIDSIVTPAEIKKIQEMRDL